MRPETGPLLKVRLAAVRNTSAMPAELVPHGGEFDLHGALKIGVENGGHGAFVFAEFADDLSSEDDREIADVKFLVLVADDFFYAALVHGIQETPEESDNEAAGAATGEIANFFAHIVFIERADDVAPRIHALLYADNHIARDERIGLVLHGQVAAFGHARAVNPLRAAAE